MLAVLISLGIWQVQRLHWKQAILAQIDAAEASPPMAMPAAPPAFAKVAVTGTLRYDATARYSAEVRDMAGGSVLGAQWLVPLQRDGLPPILVDLGWVPDGPDVTLPRLPAAATVVGFVRPPEHPAWFSANDDLATRVFYTLDPQPIGVAIGFPNVALFTLVALGEAPAGRLPAPALHLPRPTNNHLQYAVTWFGLAFVLVVIFVTFVVKGSRA